MFMRSQLSEPMSRFNSSMASWNCAIDGVRCGPSVTCALRSAGYSRPCPTWCGVKPGVTGPPPNNMLLNRFALKRDEPVVAISIARHQHPVVEDVIKDE